MRRTDGRTRRRSCCPLRGARSVGFDIYYIYVKWFKQALMLTALAIRAAGGGAVKRGKTMPPRRFARRKWIKPNRIRTSISSCKHCKIVVCPLQPFLLGRTGGRGRSQQNGIEEEFVTLFHGLGIGRKGKFDNVVSQCIEIFA